MMHQDKQGLQQFTQAAGGMLRACIVAHDDIEMLLGLLTRDPWTRACLECVQKCLDELEKHRVPRPMCLCCEHRFSRTEVPPAFLLLLSGVLGDASHAMASPICAQCYIHKPRAQINDQALTYIKEIWPGSKPILVAPGSDMLQ